MDKKLKKYYFVNGCKRNRRYNRVVNTEKDYKDKKRYHNLNHNEDLLYIVPGTITLYYRYYINI